MAAARFLVEGRVQGVFFRASTREQALGLGLRGHAVNLDDGTVEVLAVGDAAVHDKQALVLVNRGRARAADVAELVRIVCERVQQRFGVALEMEPIWLPRPTAV